MPLPECSTSLFEKYKYERFDDTITEDQFHRILLIFPAILITQANGHTDTSEMLHLMQLVKRIGFILNEKTEIDISKEIRYLRLQTELWRDLFLKCLKAYLDEFPIGDQIVDIMIAAASSSTGNLSSNILLKNTNPNDTMESKDLFVSGEERDEILSIVDYLGLDEDEAISWKLSQVLRD